MANKSKANEHKKVEVQFGAVDWLLPEIPVLTEKVAAGKNYFNYGEDNLYPQYLYNLYVSSSLLQTIIDTMARYVLGNEVITNGDLDVLKDKANRNYETFYDVLQKVITDYLIYGGFALEILRNKMGGIAELYWLDMQKVRVGKNGDTVLYSNYWDKWSPKAIEIPMYNGKQKHEVLYYNGNKTRSNYPIPRYSGALTSIETSIEIAKYHLQSLKNNFNTSAIISFNNGTVDDDTADMIEEKLQKKFCGSENAAKFMLVFNDSKDNDVTVQRLETDNSDQKFIQLKEDVQNEIFVAFAAQPCLFGVLVKTGFNEIEYISAFKLFQSTVIKPIQHDLERLFARLFDSPTALVFVPFTIEDKQEIIEENNKGEEVNE